MGLANELCQLSKEGRQNGLQLKYNEVVNEMKNSAKIGHFRYVTACTYDELEFIKDMLKDEPIKIMNNQGVITFDWEK